MVDFLPLSDNSTVLNHGVIFKQAVRILGDKIYSFLKPAITCNNCLMSRKFEFLYYLF